jgi:hypothetical protein
MSETTSEDEKQQALTFATACMKAAEQHKLSDRARMSVGGALLLEALGCVDPVLRKQAAWETAVLLIDKMDEESCLCATCRLKRFINGYTGDVVEPDALGALSTLAAEALSSLDDAGLDRFAKTVREKRNSLRKLPQYQVRMTAVGNA